MLVGKFSCSGCSEILHCQELRICSWCDDVLCSLCQFSKCTGSVEKGIFHKTKKLESLIGKAYANFTNQDEADLLEYGERMKRRNGLVDSEVEQKLNQLGVCAAVVTRTLKQNEEKAQRTRLEIRSTMKQMIVKFARMVKHQEKKLQRKLRQMRNQRTKQLTNILQNMSHLDHLMKHSCQQTVPAEPRGHAEKKYIERLNVMRLMVSFGSAVEARTRFKPLTDVDMRKAFQTLPELGVFQAYEVDKEEALFSGMDALPAPADRNRAVTKSSAKKENVERGLSDEDSIGETDRDFGEYHIGKSLVKVVPHQRVNVAYQNGYNVLDRDITVHDETPLRTEKSEASGRQKFLHRIPNAIRRNFLSNITGRTTSHPAVLRNMVACTGTDVSVSGTTETVHDKQAIGNSSKTDVDELSDNAENLTLKTKRDKRRFFNRNTHKIKPNSSTEDTAICTKTTADHSNDDVFNVKTVSSSCTSARKTQTRFIRNGLFSGQHARYIARPHISSSQPDGLFHSTVNPAQSSHKSTMDPKLTIISESDIEKERKGNKTQRGKYHSAAEYSAQSTPSKFFQLKSTTL